MSRVLLVLLFSLFVLPASAAVVRDLYQAQVPVAAQSPAELKRAARSGLAEVLVRVSGRADSARHAALGEALAQADRYVEQYRYDTVAPPAVAEPLEQSFEAAAPQPIVVLSFAPGQIQSLLRKAGLPVWGANRPTLLVWLALDDGSSRTLVNEESQPELVQALREEARRRGLLLNFPLLDLDDLAAVTTDLVWQMDLGRLDEASQRYRADGLLVGRIAALPSGRWLGGLRMVAGELRLSFDGEGTSLANYLAPSIDRVADALSSQYASVSEGSAPDEVLLRLADIQNFAEYSRALDYLGRLSQVRTVLPVEMAGGDITLRLEINGGVAQLQRALALDHRMQPLAADPLAPVPVNGQLRYRWVARG